MKQKKHLFVDIGNSCIKAAVLSGLEWELVYKKGTGKENHFYRWLDENLGEAPDENRVVVCCVVEQVKHRLSRRYPPDQVRLLSHRDIPAALVEYDHRERLGLDRFFACYGAVGQTSRTVVVIDAGTACTIDCMTNDQIFRGGVIMPGHQIMIESISHKIPSLTTPDELLPSGWPGSSTLDSLRWGTTGAFLEAIRSFLLRYRETFGELTVFATGGSSPVVCRYLGEEFSIRERPFLLFQGLNAFVKRFPRERE